ncbi:quaternary ammonium compound efflux SMR transporter SugE [Bacillus salitolerans]|uniref:Quaternary ammonium compound efflux SMR transporter SugE n=1 Tax=Bacillus salitolerans TaxID=1437434 RepID=A0ABW4LWY3_9BACI
MAWIYLVIAGIFEVIWAIGLKYTEGFTKLYPTIVTIVGMIISFYFLSIAVKTLPIGTAYAVWTGIGAIGAIVVGMIVFNEPKDLLRILFLLFILTGIVGLKVTSGNH